MKEEQTTIPINVIWESVKLGFKAGLFLSTIYAVVGTFVILLMEDSIEDFLMVLGMGSIFIILWAIAPSAIIGSLTGTIIGVIAEASFARQFSKIAFSFMSITICVLIALLIHILFGLKIVLSFDSPPSSISIGNFATYPFLFGIPTIIYMIAGGWFGWKIYSKFITS